MSTEKIQEAGAATETEFALDDFASLLRKEFKPNNEERASRIDQAVATLAQQALADSAIIGDDVFSTMDKLRSAIDAKLTEQVNQIIHNEEFKALESAWRGLHYMVMNTSTGKDLKIRVLNIGKDECYKMFRQYRDAAWDQSPLFKRIYEAEFGQLGGQPYGSIVCDYYFDHSAPDLRGAPGHRAGVAAVQWRADIAAICGELCHYFTFADGLAGGAADFTGGGQRATQVRERNCARRAR